VTEHEVGFPTFAANSYIVRDLTGVAECQALVDRPEAVSSRTRQMARFGRWLERSRPWAERAATTFADTILATFETYAVVLTPGAVQRPTRIGELDGKGAVRTLYESGRRIPHFAPWNATGQPAISIPAGFSELGLPVSVQLAGRPHDETTLLQLARQLEVAQTWDGHRPPLAL
jgi:amidase